MATVFITAFIMMLLANRTRSFTGVKFTIRTSRLSRLNSVSKTTRDYRQEEYVVSTVNQGKHFDELRLIRPNINIFTTADERIAPGDFTWTNFCNGIQLDSTLLEDHHTRNFKSSEANTAQLWQSTICERLTKKNPPFESSSSFRSELEIAIDVVQRATYVVRSLQSILLNSTSNHSINKALRSTSDALSSCKADKTPVTVADFVIQTLIIDSLSTAYPDDLFIAEEDSSIVRTDPAIREAVLIALCAATGSEWSTEKLYSVLDKGSFGSSTGHSPHPQTRPSEQRVWVLDPIDGTKGFMRGEHCCTALGLLVGGVTKLSVLGCPNLNLLRLLQGSSYDDRDICYIDPPLSLHAKQSGEAPTVFHPHSGSVYFAVTGLGAYARMLSMPLGAAFEVLTSGVADSTQARLCESAEALFGDREVSARTAEKLGMTKDYLRIDGMCKHCVVGVGAAEATLRLPPAGYREKIWDHVAGDHFVREAGGMVTDLKGARLDYSAVKDAVGNAMHVERVGIGAIDKASCRELSAEVQGVVISNSKLHAQIVNSINDVRSVLHRQ